MNFVPQTRHGQLELDEENAQLFKRKWGIRGLHSPVLLGEERVLFVLLLPLLPEVPPDGEHVPLGGEEELLAPLVDGVVDVEQEVEVLACGYSSKFEFPAKNL